MASTKSVNVSKNIPLNLLTGGLETRHSDGMTDKNQTFLSMKESGLIVPILVRPDPKVKGSYQVVCGYRRLAAAKLLNWGHIEATVRDLKTPEQVAMARALENIDRVRNTPPEIAKMLFEHHKETGASGAKMAAGLGCAVSYPNNLIRAWRALSVSDRQTWLENPKAFKVRELIAAAAGDEDPTDGRKGSRAESLKTRKAKEIKETLDSIMGQETRTDLDAAFAAALEYALGMSDWTPVKFTGDGEAPEMPEHLASPDIEETPVKAAPTRKRGKR